MKKILVIILALAMCLSLAACGEEVESAKSSTAQAEEKVLYNLQVRINSGYIEDATFEDATTYARYTGKSADGETTYEVTGKITIRDRYGDFYTAEYDAEVRFLTEETPILDELEIGTFYKD